MNSFTTIPFIDILSFLSSQSIPTNNPKTYETALHIIRSDRVKNSQEISAPTSVIDWIISDNLLDNNISIFDTLFDDILFAILHNLDCDEILSICLISVNFNKLAQKEEVSQILRKKLRERTRLNLDHYNRKELVFLSKYTERINISAVHEHGFYIKNGNVCVFEKAINNLSNTDIPILLSDLKNIKQISAGSYHTLLLTKDGQVYSFGDNEAGQLGLGHYKYIDMDTPTLIPELNNIVQISAGEDHSLLLTQNGEIYSFGDNQYGQLGLGDYEERSTPTLVPDINNIIQISAGGYYSLLLNKNGEIYSFGSNTYGKLGLGLEHCQKQNIPTLVPIEHFNNSFIVQVSAGIRHSLALSAEGNVYSFGCSSHGELQLGDINDRNVPTLIPADYFNNQRVSHVSAGKFNSLILTENGQLYSFGEMVYQQSEFKENYRGNLPTLINGVENVIDTSIGYLGLLMVNKYGEIYYFRKTRRDEKIIGAQLLLDKIL